MEVAPVDEGEGDLAVDAELLGGIQPGEPASDDDDPVPLVTRQLAGGGRRAGTQCEPFLPFVPFVWLTPFV